MSEYDHITRDLAHKAADDAVDAIYRTMALHDDIASKTMIAMMAAGQCLAVAAGATAAKLNLSPDDPRASEVVVDALWTTIRPITLSAIKDFGRRP